jgi:very-short-patch-repair endonuclease
MHRLRYRAPKSPFRLEKRFLMLWKHAKGPELEREYRFHHERRWLADFAQMEARVLIEIEGGIWVNGRHNRASKHGHYGVYIETRRVGGGGRSWQTP